MSSFLTDPSQILKSMLLPLHDPTKLWGDIVIDDEANPVLQRIAAAQRNAAAESEARREVEAHQQALDDAPWDADILEGWEVPDLTLRKGIWENFPVDVKPITSTDGTERYRINWNNIKYETAHAAADTSEYGGNFEDWTQHRLLTALRAHPHKYTVEPARDNSMICVIAMVHSAPAAAATAVAPATSLPTNRIRALDVLRSGKFPISWDRADGSKIHYIKLHTVNAAKTGATANSVRNALETALSACTDCEVERATGKYILVVKML